METIVRICLLMLPPIVTAQVPPEITPFKLPTNIIEGRRLSLFCSVTIGTPPISFSWMKDGHGVGSLPAVKVSHGDEYQNALQIESVSVDHVGNYTCSAKNAFGTDQMSVQVILKFKPRWNVASDVTNVKIMSVVTGQNLVLDCSATGHPVPTIKILKESRELSSEGRLELQAGVLTIRRMESVDKGEYICVAENILGRIRKIVSVALSGNVPNEVN